MHITINKNTVGTLCLLLAPACLPATNCPVGTTVGEGGVCLVHEDNEFDAGPNDNEPVLDDHDDLVADDPAGDDEVEGPSEDAARSSDTHAGAGIGIGNVCPGDTALVDMPWLSQQLPGKAWRHNMCCGPAAVAMVEAFVNDVPADADLLRGVISWLDFNIADWSDNSGLCDVDGTEASEIVRALHERAGVVVDERNLGWCDVKALLDGHHVVIFLADAQGTNATSAFRAGASHWLIARGVDGGDVLVLDPGRSAETAGKKRYTEASVRARYEARGNVAIVIDLDEAAPVEDDCVDADDDGFGFGCDGGDCDDDDSEVHTAAECTARDAPPPPPVVERVEVRRLFHGNGLGCLNVAANFDHCLALDGATCAGANQGGTNYVDDGNAFFVYPAALGAGANQIVVDGVPLAGLHSCFNADVLEHFYDTFDDVEMQALRATAGWRCTSAPIGYVRTGTPALHSVPGYRSANAALSDRMYGVVEGDGDSCGYVDEGVAFHVWRGE